MSSLKKVGALGLVVCALGAIGAANASAETFTASATGSLTGRASLSQVFKTNGGYIECTSAAVSGVIESTAATSQHVTVKYSGCKAFGFSTVHIPPATYLLTANGGLHIKNTITVTPTFFGSSICTVTFGPQASSFVFVDNEAGGYLRESFRLLFLSYTSTGGPCGASGNNGTYEGDLEVHRVGGGSLYFDS